MKKTEIKSSGKPAASKLKAPSTVRSPVSGSDRSQSSPLRAKTQSRPDPSDLSSSSASPQPRPGSSNDNPYGSTNENADDVSLLSEQITSLTRKLEKAQHDSSSKTSQIEELKQQLTQVSDEKTRVLNEKAALAKEHDKLQSELAGDRSRSSSLAEERKLSMTTTSEVKEALNKRRIKELEQQLSNTKSSHDKIRSEKEQLRQTMQKEIDRLKSDISHIDANYVSKLESLETKRMKDIQYAKQETVKALERREKELFALQDQHRKLKEDVGLTREDVRAAEEKVAKLKDVEIGVLEEKIDQLQQEVEVLRAESVAKDLENEQIKERFIAEINAISDSVENELQEKDVRIKELETEMEDEKANWERQRSEFEQEMERLSEELATSREDNREDSAALQQQAETIDRLNKEIEQHNHINNQLNNDINKLKKQISAYKKDRDKLTAATEKERMRLEDEFLRREHEMAASYSEKETRLNQTISEYEDELQRLREELQEQNDLTEEMQQIHDSAAAAAGHSSSSKAEPPVKTIEVLVPDTESKEAAEKAKEGLEKLQEVVERLRAENEKLVNDNSDFMQNLERREQEIKDINATHQKQGERTIELERENALMMAKLTQMQTLTQRAMDEAERIHSKFSKSQADLAAREKERKQLEDEVRRQAYNSNMKDMYLSKLDTTANQVQNELFALAKRVSNIANTVRQVQVEQARTSSQMRNLQRENAALKIRRTQSASNVSESNSLTHERKRAAEFTNWTREITERLKRGAEAQSIRSPANFASYPASVPPRPIMSQHFQPRTRPPGVVRFK